MITNINMFGARVILVVLGELDGRFVIGKQCSRLEIQLEKLKDERPKPNGFL